MKFEPGDRVETRVPILVKWIPDEKKFFTVVAYHQKPHVPIGTPLTVVGQTENKDCYYLEASHVGIVVEGEPITEVAYWGGYLEHLPPLVQLAETAE